MRPVRLTLQAFGPFAGTEIVDFRDAIEVGLFGIYGKTGAGKSSIFSGMTFALFGEPARPEQDPGSLRSDHANIEMLTEVEFVFDIGERRYVVRRRPEQSRPKQRGTGETRSPHEAWLFDATGLTLEEISGGNCGKIIAERKTGVVEAEIKNLLGYGVEQFRQIVLLPQGRFEAFLAANTKDRLAILRSLFDVSLYRRLTAKMKATAEDAEREVRTEREICSRLLSTEGFESAEALTVGIELAGETRNEAVNEESTALNVLSQARNALEQARDVEKLFAALEAAQADVAVFAATAPEIEQIAQRVAALERARSLLDVESHVREAQAGLKEALEKHVQCEATVINAQDRSRQATETLANETALSGEIVRLQNELEALSRLRTILEKSALAEEQAQKCNLAFKTQEAAVAKAERDLAKRITERDRLVAELQTARINEEQRQVMSHSLTLLTAAFHAAMAYEKGMAGIEAAAGHARDLQTRHDESRTQLQTAKVALQAAEQQLADAQALHLAQKLVDGAPCPVCGAPHHPSPATGHVENTGLDAAFRQARQHYEQAQLAEREWDRKSISAREILSERQSQWANVELPEQSSLEIGAEIETCKAAIKALGEAVDVANLDRQLQQLGQQMEAEQRMLTQLQSAAHDAKTAMAVAQSRHIEMLADIPENLRTLSALDASVASKQKALLARQTAIDKAKEQATAAREALIAAERDMQAATDAVTLQRRRLDKSQQTFAARLGEVQMREEDFQALKPGIVDIQRDRDRVEQHRQQWMAAQQAVANCREKTLGLTRQDLTPLEDHCVIVAKEHEAAQERRLKAEAQWNQLCRLREKIETTLERLDRLEQSSGPLRRLAALFDGKNGQNLGLETFAIGAMFDQVLNAANLRLGPMTGHRYHLEREIELSGRGRRGLGIRVSDVYTGKSRPTSTLSGGESFIAAMALALGLADVVESSSGKVQLDTIFIDEGFGSLDAESGTGTLDQVLDVLNTLVSNRRAVGLISHVREVQEAIPNGFYVDRGLSGSTIQTRNAL
ncbi:exonuclease SbcC [Agrobacterium vitis]|nr:exonuclease SbcC [Agrobacterium vitis]